MATTINLEMTRGTTYAIRVEYLLGGVPRTLVGATLRFTVKTAEFDADADDSEALLVKNVTIHVDAAGGISMIQLDPTDTATVDPGDYFYDIRVEEAGGATYVISKGRFRLDGSPTNRTT